MDPDIEFSTDIIKITPGKFRKILFRKYGLYWSLGGVGIAVVLLVLGFVADYRFIFLAFFWILLILPLLSVFLYLYHGLKPLTVYNSMPHKVVFNKNNITIHLYDHPEKKKMAVDKVKENLSNPEPEAFRIICLENYILKDLNMDFESVTIDFSYPSTGFLWLPLKDLNRDEILRGYRMLAEKIKESQIGMGR